VSALEIITNESAETGSAVLIDENDDIEVMVLIDGAGEFDMPA